MKGNKKRKGLYDKSYCSHQGPSSSSSSSPPHHHHDHQKRKKKNPKRGGPAMLLACETGLERKCLRDGLDILQHYYKRMFCQKTSCTFISTVAQEQQVKDDKKLTLEEEIQLLKAGKSVDSVLDKKHAPMQLQQEATNDHDHCDDDDDDDDIEPFQVYETGIGGTVLIMYVSSDTKDGHQEDTSCTAAIRTNPVWDPVETITTILQHLKFPDTCKEEPPPRSRFVTRMIPLQQTCFPSMEEILPTLKHLLSTYILPYGIQAYKLRRQLEEEEEQEQQTPSIDKKKMMMTEFPRMTLPTFKVEFRRRYCNHITRDIFIDWVIQSLSNLILESLSVHDITRHDHHSGQDGEKEEDVIHSTPDATQIVNTLFKVDLTKPDFTIMMEICKNMCGMSVISDQCNFHNFNLIEVVNSNNS